MPSLAAPTPDAGIRARVVRLLRDDVRLDDLTRLFLYARDRCDGRESVREVGDFVAHHSEREKGPVTRITRDWCITSRFHWWAISQNFKFDRDRLPANFGEVLEALFRRATPDLIRRTGKSRKDIAARLPAMIRGLRKNIDGTVALNSFYTNSEVRVITILSGSLVASPAFDADRLFDDFIATLRSNSILEKLEEKEFKKLKAPICLFAASEMHNSTVVMPDGGKVKLLINPGNNKDASISVSANVEIFDETFKRKTNAGGIFMSTAIYSTSILPDAGCAGDLLAVAPPWNFDIELTADRLLDRLG